MTASDDRPATFADLQELETRLDTKIERELARMCVQLADKRNLVQWIVGIAMVLLMAYSAYLNTSVLRVDESVRKHHEDFVLHPTAQERIALDKEERTWREGVLNRLNAIELELKAWNRPKGASH